MQRDYYFILVNLLTSEPRQIPYIKLAEAFTLLGICQQRLQTFTLFNTTTANPFIFINFIYDFIITACLLSNDFLLELKSFTFFGLTSCLHPDITCNYFLRN